MPPEVCPRLRYIYMDRLVFNEAFARVNELTGGGGGQLRKTRALKAKGTETTPLPQKQMHF